jgi:glutamate-ammonia-ligase adenylyltransferase
MAADVVIREVLGRIASTLLPALLESPDPDAAVAGMSEYVAARTSRAMFLEYLAEDPRAMHVLACVFGSSGMLSEILIRNPENFHWLVSQVERSAPEREDLDDELEAMLASVEEPAEALHVLGRWQRRELLRIATRDLLRRETVPAATAQLSDVAGVAVDHALAIVTARRLRAESRAAAPGKMAIIGLGALGGRELAYDSGLDLLYVFEEADGSDRPFFERLGCDLTEALDEGEKGEGMYHVRATACSFDEYGRRLSTSGGMAERLALMKGRPVAGDADLGGRFVHALRPFVFSRTPDRAAIGALLRDSHQVERVTQLFQLAHGAQNPAVCQQTGTLAALDALAAARLIPDAAKRELAQRYVFLKTVEHRLQLVDENQTGLGSSEDLEKQVSACRSRVSEICRGLAVEL